jgi:N-acetylglucosamine kinase-like BadF-type ATPase
VLREKDRGEYPALLGKLVEAFGAEDFDQFIVKLNGNPVPDFSTLFPAVLSSAEDGDVLARAVLERGGRELAMKAGTLIERLFGHDTCSVISYGGVFSSSKVVGALFASELQIQCPNAVLIARPVDPARGALERARRGFKAASA